MQYLLGSFSPYGLLTRVIGNASKNSSLLEAKLFAPYKIAALVEAAAGQGITQDTVLLGTQLDASQMHDSSTLTSLSQYIEACDNVLGACAHISTAFQMGGHLPLSAYGVYGHGLMCSATLRDFSISP